MNRLLLIAIGLSGGAIVGTGMSAFITVLGVVVRIMDLSKTQRYGYVHKIAILLGSVVSTFIYLFKFDIRASRIWLLIVGLFMGVFVGMVASALAETLDVLPFTSNNMGINRWVYLWIIALIFGKIIGSIIYWIIPGFY